MNGNLKMNLLFYSRQCNVCINLIKILENEGLIQYFYPVCVDDKLNKLPPQIEFVPTMIVKDQNKPLVAEETFEWIKKVKFIKQNAKSGSGLINNNVLSSMATKSGLKGFSNTEMGDNSDKFAYTKDDAPALPQSFFEYGGENNNSIFTAPEQSKKLSEEEQKKLISHLESKRNTQDTQYKQHAKKQQLATLINNEQERIKETYKQGMNNNNMEAMQNMHQQQLDKINKMQQMQNQLRMKQMNGGGFNGNGNY